MINRQYPIGPFVYAGPLNAETRKPYISRIASLPERVRAIALQFDEEALATPYREGGWTARQVLHHLADSHTHVMLRFKFALAENNAAISAYPEELWANLPDATAPISLALAQIEAIHKRWVWILERMTEEDYQRTFLHPEKGPVVLDRAVQSYAWHGDHHLAHLELVLNR